MTGTIAAIDTEHLRVRLRRPWADDVQHNHFITVRVMDEDGAVGRGFTWTPSIGATAVRSLIDDDISRWAVGRTAGPEDVWDALWPHLHEAGGGGVTTIAMAGLDLALWDLRARRHTTSVPGLLGVRRRNLDVYGSGVNRHLDLDDLLLQVDRWVAAGYAAIKIKVGGRPLDEDVQRVRAVRAAIGDRALMIDANQLWTRDEAVAAASRLADFDIRWLEEPLRAEDLNGYRSLAAGPIALAAGENVHTWHRFGEFFAVNALGYAQPNVIRVGGITPFLRVAATAADHGVPVLPHLLPELSGLLATTLPEPTWVEDVEDSSLTALGVLDSPAPVHVDGPRAHLAERPGLGLVFRTENHRDNR